MNLTINHAWLALGLCFIGMSLPTLITYPNFGSLIGVGAGVLVSYTSMQNLGGWRGLKRSLGIWK